MEKRPDWNEYFLQIAKAVSERSVCFRNHCGSIIVKDKHIISTGYNGSPVYQKNCQEIGYCYRERNKIKSGTELERCRAVGCHAESNAISLAARHNGGCDGATIYLYGHRIICNQCKGMIANAGIKRVVYEDQYGTIVEIIPERDWTIHPIDQDLLSIIPEIPKKMTQSYCKNCGHPDWMHERDLKPLFEGKESEWHCLENVDGNLCTCKILVKNILKKKKM